VNTDRCKGGERRGDNHDDHRNALHHGVPLFLRVVAESMIPAACTIS
jgi:hypothetical protein